MKRHKEIIISGIFLALLQLILFFIFYFTNNIETGLILMIVFIVIWGIIIIGLWLHDKSINKKYYNNNSKLSNKDELLISLDLPKSESNEYHKQVSFDVLRAIRKKNNFTNIFIAICGIVYASLLYVFMTL